MISDDAKADIIHIYTKHGYRIRSTHPLILVFIWGSQSKRCWLNGSHEDLKQLFSSVTKYKVTKCCYHIFCCYSYVVICFTKVSPQGQIEKKILLCVLNQLTSFEGGGNSCSSLQLLRNGDMSISVIFILF